MLTREEAKTLQGPPQKTADISPILVYCWATVYDDVTTSPVCCILAHYICLFSDSEGQSPICCCGEYSTDWHPAAGHLGFCEHSTLGAGHSPSICMYKYNLYNLYGRICAVAYQINYHLIWKIWFVINGQVINQISFADKFIGPYGYGSIPINHRWIWKIGFMINGQVINQIHFSDKFIGPYIYQINYHWFSQNGLC